MLAQKKPRYGYRRLWVLLRREGRGVNLKRVYRLYWEAGSAAGRALGGAEAAGAAGTGGGAAAGGEPRMAAGLLERRGGSPAGGSGF